MKLGPMPLGGYPECAALQAKEIPSRNRYVLGEYQQAKGPVLRAFQENPHPSQRLLQSLGFSV